MPQLPSKPSTFQRVKAQFSRKNDPSSSADQVNRRVLKPLQIIDPLQHVIPAGTNDQLAPVPGPTDDRETNFAIVDAEREATSSAISDMQIVGRPVQDTAARISKADNPINFMDSLSSTLKSLGNFNSIVDKIAMVRNFAMHFHTSVLIESPDPPLCPSSMDSSQFRLQGSPIKTFFPMIKNHPLQDNH
jgi:hypothetical protein